jgi:hypothetical protein
MRSSAAHIGNLPDGVVEEKQCHVPKEGRLSALVCWVKEEE